MAQYLSLPVRPGHNVHTPTTTALIYRVYITNIDRIALEWTTAADVNLLATSIATQFALVP